MDNQGFENDGLAVTTEIHAPLDSIALSGDQTSGNWESLRRHRSARNIAKRTTISKVPTDGNSAKSTTISKFPTDGNSVKSTTISKFPTDGNSAKSTTIAKIPSLSKELVRKSEITKPAVTTVFKENESGYTRKETVVYGQKGVSGVYQHLRNTTSVDEVNLQETKQKTKSKDDVKMDQQDGKDVRQTETYGRQKTRLVGSGLIHIPRSKQGERIRDTAGTVTESNVEIKIDHHYNKDFHQPQTDLALTTAIISFGIADMPISKRGERILDTSLHTTGTVTGNNVETKINHHNGENVYQTQNEFGLETARVDSRRSDKTGSKQGERVDIANRSSPFHISEYQKASHEVEAQNEEIDKTRRQPESMFSHHTAHTVTTSDDRIRNSSVKESGYNASQGVPEQACSHSNGVSREYYQTEAEKEGTDSMFVRTDTNDRSRRRQEIRRRDATAHIVNAREGRIIISGFKEDEYISGQVQTSSTSFGVSENRKDAYQTETIKGRMNNAHVFNANDEERRNVQNATGSDNRMNTKGSRGNGYTPVLEADNLISSNILCVSETASPDSVKDRRFREGPSGSSSGGGVSSSTYSSSGRRHRKTEHETNVSVSKQPTQNMFNSRSVSPYVLTERGDVSNTNIFTIQRERMEDNGHRQLNVMKRAVLLQDTSLDLGVVQNSEGSLDTQATLNSQPSAADMEMASLRNSTKSSTQVKFVGKGSGSKNVNASIAAEAVSDPLRTSSPVNPLANWTHVAGESYISGAEDRYEGDMNTDIKRSIVYVKNSVTNTIEPGTSATLSYQEKDIGSHHETESRETSLCSDSDVDYPFIRKSMKFGDFQTDSDNMSSHTFYMGTLHELTSIQKASEPKKVLSHTTNYDDKLGNQFDASIDHGDKTPDYGRATTSHCPEPSVTKDNESSTKGKAPVSQEYHFHRDGVVTKRGMHGKKDTSRPYDKSETGTDGPPADKEVLEQPTSADTSLLIEKYRNVNVQEDKEEDDLKRINVVEVDNDSGDDVTMNRVKSWVAETDPRCDGEASTEPGAQSDPERLFDRHSIAEMPIMVVTTAVPKEFGGRTDGVVMDRNDDVFYHADDVFVKNGNDPISRCHHLSKDEHIQLDPEVLIRHNGNEGHCQNENRTVSSEKRSIQNSCQKKQRSVSKPNHASIEMANLKKKNICSSEATTQLPHEQFFNKGFFEGWAPTSPYAHHIQRNPSSLSESDQHTAREKTKVRQLSLAIGEEWEDMTGMQPVTDAESTDSMTLRCSRQIIGHQLSWGGSSDYLGRTFRYLSHPGRLENYWRRNTISEESHSVTASVSPANVEAEQEHAKQEIDPQDRPDTEKRWLLPNPYNRFNQRCHSTLQCPCCLFFCFLCCLPAVYFMQLSDKEFDYGSKDKARVLGKRASFLYVIGAIVSIITLSVVTSVVVIYLQEYLTRKQT